MATEKQMKQWEDMSERLDKTLLKILKEGQQVFDQKESVVVSIDPTASVLSVIRMRLRDLQIDKDANSGGSAKELAALAARKGIRIEDLPECDDVPDELAG